MPNWSSRCLLGCLLLTLCVSPGWAQPSPGRDVHQGHEVMANEVLVKFRDPDAPVAPGLRRLHDLDLVTGVAGGRAILLRSRSKKVAQLIQGLSSRSDVLYVEPNYIAEAYFVPNDTFFSLQWHLDNPVYGGIHAQQAWEFSTGVGVTVAVIDTGVAYENYQIYVQAPDLAGTLFVAGYDFINNDAHANDDNNHGTHVAGTIAQSTNNALGTAGVAFGATVMPVKVLSASGSGSYAAVASGITFAADNGAQVINMSLGGPSPSQTLLNAVQYAHGLGVTIVAAAGNDGSATIGYPAAYSDYVIAVGATRYDETLSYYSNYGQDLSLVAPGGDVTVDQNGDFYGDGVLQQTFNGAVSNFGYYFFQGTSMATPHVAGVAALVIANGVSGPAAVRQVLETTADDLGAPGWDSTYGWGLVNAAAAVQAADPTPDIGPPSQPTGLTATPIGPSQIDLAWNPSTDDVGVTGYNVYRDNVLVTTVGGQAYSDIGLAAATSYLYELSAVDAAANESTRSSAVSAVTPALPPAPQTVTLTIVDGFDETEGETLIESGQLPVLLSSDDDRLETEAGFYGSYEFSDLTLPAGALITSVEIFVEHYEEGGYLDGALEWSIGTGWPNAPVLWATSSGVPVRKPQPNETVDSWDVTGFITPENLNLLELMVKNNENNRSTNTDLAYVVVNFSTGPPPNQPPTANAGPDQTVNDADGTGSETVTLNGSGSDSDGTIASYQWTEGAVVLGNAATLTTSFTVGTHTLTLTVTDDGEATGSDTVLVTVNANQPPTADAGPDQTVNDADGTGSETVTLNGGGTDSDGTIVSYEWKEGATVLGTTAGLTAPFTVGTHTVILTATDDGSASGSDTVLVTVNPVLQSITVTPSNPSIEEGQTQQFSATGNYSDSSTQDLTSTAAWSSTDMLVATINASGLASGEAAGASNISATQDGVVSDTAALTVTAPPPPTLQSITVSPASASIERGQTQQFSATGNYSDSSTQDLTGTAAWSSTDMLVATITAAGLASGEAAGASNISATQDGVVSDTAALTVTEPPPTLQSITVSPAGASIEEAQTQQFSATGNYSDSSTQDLTGTATWSSTNTAVATINASGLAGGVAAGSSNITATQDSVVSNTAVLTVTAPPPPTLQSITVSPASASIEEAQTHQFSATGNYSDSSTQDLTGTAAWSSTNTLVATINAAGLASGVAAGTSNITATQDSVVSNTAVLTVTAQSSDVVTIVEAVCAQEDGELFVEAASTDGTATLTVVGFGVMENLGGGEYEFVATGVSSCPLTVTVASNKGGSATANVELD